MNIFIIHGAYGNPQENWFPWLKNELEEEGCKVIVPKFPTPENQNLDSWLEVFKNYEKYVAENTIFVGHSIGPAFILNILERINVKVLASFFVSGFIGQLPDKKFNVLNDSFANKKFDFEKIKRNCKKFFVIDSDNDPYVPLSKGQELADKLNAEQLTVNGARHFNEDSDYIEFPMLFNLIKEECNKFEKRKK